MDGVEGVVFVGCVGGMGGDVTFGRGNGFRGKAVVVGVVLSRVWGFWDRGGKGGGGLNVGSKNGEELG